MIEKFYLTICTLGENPHLEECIKALVQLKRVSTYPIEILVVINKEDDDMDFPDTVFVIFEPKRGYSNVRNKAISAIPKGANIVFLDDDEIPTSDWLNVLISAHNANPGDLIAGPVYAEEGINVPSYRSLASKKYANFEDGSCMKQAPTANMLIPASLIEKGLIHFDPIYNFSGSEDTDLCFRLRKVGVKIRYAKFAALYEKQKAERYDPEYLMKRRYKDVSNYSLVIRRNSSSYQIVWRGLTLAIRVIVYTVLGVFSTSVRFEGRIHLSSLKVLITGKPIQI